MGNEEKVKIEEVKKVFSVLGKMYQIKEEIRDIFETQTMGDEAFNRHKEQARTLVPDVLALFSDITNTPELTPPTKVMLVKSITIIFVFA